MCSWTAEPECCAMLMIFDAVLFEAHSHCAHVNRPEERDTFERIGETTPTAEAAAATAMAAVKCKM